MLNYLRIAVTALSLTACGVAPNHNQNDPEFYCPR